MTISKGDIVQRILNKSGINGQVTQATSYDGNKCLGVLEMYMVGLPNQNITTTYIPTAEVYNKPNDQEDSGITTAVLPYVVDYITPYFMDVLMMPVPQIFYSQSQSALDLMDNTVLSKPKQANTNLPAGTGNCPDANSSPYLTPEPE